MGATSGGSSVTLGSASAHIAAVCGEERWPGRHSRTRGKCWSLQAEGFDADDGQQHDHRGERRAQSRAFDVARARPPARNAQPVTIAAPQIAITAANQATGSSATGSATRRELVCRYPFHVIVRASKTHRVNASASQLVPSSAHIESSGTLDHMRMSWIAMQRAAPRADQGAPPRNPRRRRRIREQLPIEKAAHALDARDGRHAQGAYL